VLASDDGTDEGVAPTVAAELLAADIQEWLDAFRRGLPLNAGGLADARAI